MRRKQISCNYNKRLLLLISLVLIFWGESQAQVLIRESNSYLSDDWLDKVQVSFREDKVGSIYIWTIESLDDSKSFSDKYIEEGDSLLYLHQGTRTYFSQKAQDVYLTGCETNQYKVHYSVPEVYLRFPFMQGSILEGDFEGMGMYCDKLAFIQKGHYLTNAEKEGCIVTESGDTILQVMLLHTHKNHQLFALNDNKCLTTFCEDEFRWYTSGCRYPVMYRKDLSLKGDAESVKSVSGTADFYPQQVQYDVQVGGEILKDGTGNPKSMSSPANFRYDASLVGSTIHVRYGLKQTSTLKILLTDVKGCLYKTMVQNNQPGEDYTVEIDCSGYPHGQYILNINVDGQTFTDKFLIK